MQNFTTATGLVYISNFDYFWSRWDLLKNYALYPDRKRTVKQTSHFIKLIDFSHNGWSPGQDHAHHPGFVLHSPVQDGAGPAATGFVSPINSLISVWITVRQCARPKFTHSPHRNNLITV